MMTYEINCPNWLHKYIIGRKGAAIQKLNEEYPNVSGKKVSFDLASPSSVQ